MRILCSAEGVYPTFAPTFVCTLHFLCAKIWLFGKLVVLLHCKEQKCPFVDVPWCNGSTRVFGSLSPRSNRSGTTSPSPRVLQSFPACKALFPQQCLYDTAFFCVCAQGVVGREFVVYKSLHFSLFLLRIHGCLFCKLATCH
mgnify:CR=1 FL=1